MKGAGLPCREFSAGMRLCARSGIGVRQACHLRARSPNQFVYSALADQLECAIWPSLSQLALTRLPELDCGMDNPHIVRLLAGLSYTPSF